jgi:hypothetical protein
MNCPGLAGKLQTEKKTLAMHGNYLFDFLQAPSQVGFDGANISEQAVILNRFKRGRDGRHRNHAAAKGGA